MKGESYIGKVLNLEGVGIMQSNGLQVDLIWHHLFYRSVLWGHENMPSLIRNKFQDAMSEGLFSDPHETDL